MNNQINQINDLCELSFIRFNPLWYGVAIWLNSIYLRILKTHAKDTFFDKFNQCFKFYLVSQSRGKLCCCIYYLEMSIVKELC